MRITIILWLPTVPRKSTPLLLLLLQHIFQLFDKKGNLSTPALNEHSTPG